MIVNTGSYWRSRTPVRRGHIDPPKLGGCIDQGSTVQRRIEIADFRRQTDRLNPQLQPGMIVILGRRPYRVVEIREKPDDLWPARYEQRWEDAINEWRLHGRGEEPQRATWRHRPVNVVVVPDGGGEEEHRLGPASFVFDVLPEHYAVCRSCGELPPCREEQLNRAVDRQIINAERLMSIPAGNCMGCGEGISSRQKTVGFPGANLWRPDLPEGSARFHARGECSDWVGEYRAQWEKQNGQVEAEQQALFGEEA